MPLKLDVTYLNVDLPTVPLRLSSSAIYSPADPADVVTTLTPTAFVADKLPTLGFDTLGYSRPTEMAGAGNPEHIFKQLHDIGALVDRGIDYSQLLPMYSAGIDARNRARSLSFDIEECLLDARRVSRIAVAGWAYPNNDDLPQDENYIPDVQHARAGIQPFRAYALAGTPNVLVSATRVFLLASGLAAVRHGSLRSSELEAMITRALELGRRARDPKDRDLRTSLAKVLSRAASPDGWALPATSRRVFGAAPDAAIFGYVGSRLTLEAESLASRRRLTLEPNE